MSLLEAIVNVTIGFGVALVAQILIYPIFGISISAGGNISIALLFTAISIVRSYALRRLFEFVRRHSASKQIERLRNQS